MDELNNMTFVKDNAQRIMERKVSFERQRDRKITVSSSSSIDDTDLEQSCCSRLSSAVVTSGWVWLNNVPDLQKMNWNVWIVVVREAIAQLENSGAEEETGNRRWRKEHEVCKKMKHRPKQASKRRLEEGFVKSTLLIDIERFYSSNHFPVSRHEFNTFPPWWPPKHLNVIRPYYSDTSPPKKGCY